jgi:hypothetical protein
MGEESAPFRFVFCSGGGGGAGAIVMAVALLRRTLGAPSAPPPAPRVGRVGATTAGAYAGANEINKNTS